MGAYDKTVSTPVEVDGYPLNPAIVNRRTIADPAKNTLTVIWP